MQQKILHNYTGMTERKIFFAPLMCTLSQPLLTHHTYPYLSGRGNCNLNIKSKFYLFRKYDNLSRHHDNSSRYHNNLNNNTHACIYRQFIIMIQILTHLCWHLQTILTILCAPGMATDIVEPSLSSPVCLCSQSDVIQSRQILQEIKEDNLGLNWA